MEQIDFPALSESMCRVFSLAVTVTHSNCCANLCQTRKVRAQQKHTNKAVQKINMKKATIGMYNYVLRSL